MAPFAVILEKYISLFYIDVMLHSVNRKVRPKMTFSIFMKIMILSLLDRVIYLHACLIDHFNYPNHAIYNDAILNFGIILFNGRPVIDKNLYFLGMKYTTPTFAASMYNVLQAITFVMAWILK